MHGLVIRSIRAACVAIAAAVLGACAASRPAGPATQGVAPATFAAALARGLPAVVGVYGVTAPGADADGDADADADAAQQPAGLSAAQASAAPANVGAGFFISSDGLIVTAAHVIEDADRVVVSLADQRVVLAEVVGADADADIAVLRVPAGFAVQPPLGASATLRAGDWVLAVGEPYGMDRAVVAGIVGGRGRHFAEDAEGIYIQSDIALNPGNSGGPLLDMRGNIVAMNLRTVVGVYGSAGLGLSMPIEIVQQIAAELSGGEAAARPRLGALFEDVPPLAAVAAGRTHASGALISSVATASLAERIGLRTGDIVVGMNGRPVGDSADLALVLLSWHEADRTRVTVFRDGRYQHLRLGAP